MKITIYLAIGIICMLFESVLAVRFPMDFFKPDFAIPFIIYVTFFMGPGPGLIMTICVGLFQESLSSAPTGSILFLKMSLFLITAIMRKQLYIDSRYSFAFACSVAVLLDSLFFFMLSVLARGDTGNMLNIFYYAVPNAIFTGFVSYFLYVFIEYLNSTYLDRE